MLKDSFKTLGLAKETESRENPGGLEKRVALVPEDVQKLAESGLQISVERGAGQGIGFSDERYQQAGAVLESGTEIYQNKDLIVKFKGPSLESIPLMGQGCTLFCMAHFHSFPERAEAFKRNKINVIAMEFVVESPKAVIDEIVLSKTAMAGLLRSYQEEGSLQSLDVGFLGWSPRLVGAIRRVANRNINSLTVYAKSIEHDELKHFGNRSIYVYDSLEFSDPSGLLSALKEKSCLLFDLHAYETERGAEAIRSYRAKHPPLKLGSRRIQCLHETGQAGARYGLKILREISPKRKEPNQARVVVLGYGNVGMGAVRESYDLGVRSIQVLTRYTTHPKKIEEFIRQADLIINGAEQAVELRGKNFLITKAHVRSILQPGSVIIDLVGGSASNRSPVESVLECTFLNDPYFVENGVYVSALWGWPMMGMMRETAIRYSGQIVEVLLGPEDLIRGLNHLAPGVKPALVSGPFERC